MKDLYLVIPAAILLLILIFLTVLHYRKKKIIGKVRSMDTLSKKKLLNSLAGTVGYLYDYNQDIFVSRQDAPQKLFGYTTLYDISAPYLNMVFDYETIYFDYNRRTWLIEMWKGQYGINSGCELGIYYADTVISPDEYAGTLFKAVEPGDMLEISLKLNRCTTKRCRQYTNLGNVRTRHWWLTIFNMGTFTNPVELFVNASIRFRDYTMMYRFLDSFEKTLPYTTYKISGLTVYFTFDQSLREYSFFRKMVRRIALIFCCIYCKWFNYLTRPFSASGDKILYIYYYLPFMIRLLFRHKSRK